MFSFLAPLWTFLMIPFQDYMDFKGQVDAERWYQIIIVVPSVRAASPFTMLADRAARHAPPSRAASPRPPPAGHWVCARLPAAVL